MATISQYTGEHVNNRTFGVETDVGGGQETGNLLELALHQAENSMTGRAYMGEVLTEVWLNSLRNECII